MQQQLCYQSKGKEPNFSDRPQCPSGEDSGAWFLWQERIWPFDAEWSLLPCVLLLPPGQWSISARSKVLLKQGLTHTELRLLSPSSLYSKPFKPYTLINNFGSRWFPELSKSWVGSAEAEESVCRSRKNPRLTSLLITQSTLSTFPVLADLEMKCCMHFLLVILWFSVLFFSWRRWGGMIWHIFPHWQWWHFSWLQLKRTQTLSPFKT